MKTVLTEELLARAERLCRIPRPPERATATVYHDGSGVSADIEQGPPAEDTKKWLT